MKMLRLALIAGGVLAALLLALAAIAFNPVFQTRVAQRMLAARPSLGVSVGGIKIGLESIRIENLRLERRGILLTAPSAEVEMSVLPAIWSHALRIGSATARGWTLDASHAELSPAERALLRGPFMSAELEAIGSVLAVHMEEPKAIHGFDLSGFSRWGPIGLQGSVILPSGLESVPGRGPLNFSLTGSPTPTGAAYAVGLDHGGRRFAMLLAHWTDATQRLSGRWKVDLDIAGTPPLSTHGEGSFGTTVEGLHVEGRLEAGANGLAKALLRTDPSVSMGLSAEFDMVGRGVAWRVDRLKAELDGRDPVLQVAALQSFGFNPETREVRLADPLRELASVSIRNLPLEWVGPWLHPFALSGSGLSGDLVATSRGGGLEFRSRSPLSITGLSASRYGRTLVHGLDLSADVSAQVRPGGWEIELAPMRASAGAASLVTLTAKLGRLAGDRQPLKLAGRLTADLPAMLAQTAPVHTVPLRAGTVDCTFAGTLAERGPVAAELEARMAFSDLVAGPARLPSVKAEVRADFDPEGRVVFNAPVRVEAEGRSSDLTLAGAVGRSRSGFAVDLQAAGARLYVEDVRFLAAPLVLGGAGRMRPFWNGISGRLAFSVKRASWPDDFEVADLGGNLVFVPGSIEIKGARASLDGGTVGLDGVLTPGSASAGRLRFEADVKLEGFDFTPYFDALEPGRPPTLEGTFDVTGRLTGSAHDLMHPPGQFRGEWHLTSKGGVFRPLSDPVEVKTAAPDKMATLGQFIGNVADTVTFRKDPKSPGTMANAVKDFSRALTGIRYDRIDISLARDDSLNLAIGSFSLISPEIRLDGSGAILSVPDTPLLAEPLALELKLAARGRTADLLRTAGLLAPSKDDLGYSDCTLPFEIGGTPARPDMDDFRTTLKKLVP